MLANIFAAVKWIRDEHLRCTFMSRMNKLSNEHTITIFRCSPNEGGKNWPNRLLSLWAFRLCSVGLGLLMGISLMLMMRMMMLMELAMDDKCLWKWRNTNYNYLSSSSFAQMGSAVGRKNITDFWLMKLFPTYINYTNTSGWMTDEMAHCDIHGSETEMGIRMVWLQQAEKLPVIN